MTVAVTVAVEVSAAGLANVCVVLGWMMTLQWFALVERVCLRAALDAIKGAQCCSNFGQGGGGGRGGAHAR